MGSPQGGLLYFWEAIMTAANYPRCLANTLREEGGWTNDPRDPGGPTMRGVIQREYTKYRAEQGAAQPERPLHQRG
jgi:lysozyme family protein